MYSQGSESIQATINLSFYSQYTSHIDIHAHTSTRNLDSVNSNTARHYSVARPVPFDLDGDGIVEAIVVPLPLSPHAHAQINGESPSLSDSTTLWTLQVMDLKPLHATHDSYIDDEGLLPMYPNTIFTSSAKPFIPVKMTTGQIFLTIKTTASTSMTDSTFDYYCGKTWQEANESCHVPCPTGLQSDCPDGEICFADTACGEKIMTENLRKEQDGYVKNTLDGIPSVATIWSNGDVTLHGITHKPCADDNNEALGLMEMWSVNPFGLGQELTSWIEFVEVDLLMEKDAPLGKYGALVIAARYRTIDHDNDGQGNEHGHEKEESSIYFALDAFTGEMLWLNDAHHRHTSNIHKNDKDTGQHSPLSSMGRRRSRLSRYTEAVRKVAESESSEDCLQHFGHLIVDKEAGVLPHSFWHQKGDRGSLEWDTMLISSHFDRKRWLQKKETKRLSWLAQELSGAANTEGKRQENRQLHFGHPNVAVFHNRHGVNVLSLRNGKQICHLSLFENMLHADINQDGTIYKIEIVARRSQHGTEETEQSRCNAIITSETSETTIDICIDRDGQPRNEARHIHGLSAAPPLLVETYDKDIMTHDIVVALSNGLLKRYDIHGRRKWTARGSFNDIPSWDQGPGAHNGYLFRIDFDGTSTYKIPAAGQRPILLIGDDKMALFTAGGGRLLDKATYPQSFAGKPILQDLNGDGTTDILITTVDGVWGYCIDITKGGSAFLKIMNGLLASFVVVAFLFSYFDDPSITSRRSTDA